MPRLILRADGGPGVGSGHLGRCLALAQAWVDSGGEAVLVAPSWDSPWLDRYRMEGIAVEAVPDRGHWVVLDGYRFGPADQEAAADLGERLLVVDDHGEVGGYGAADVVLDQNLGAVADPYRRHGAGPDLLLGPLFALLRREFGDVEPAGAIPARAAKVLVTLGGAPASTAVTLVSDALERLSPSLLPVWLSGTGGDVAAAMAGADLAVSAAGSTCWELCRMGLPSVLVPIAANQLPLAEALHAAGAAHNAGPYEDLSADGLADAIAMLAGDARQRAAMAEQGRRLVDGKGATRVAARLRADLLMLRPAQESDCRLLWEWANDPTARAFAFSAQEIGWDEHVVWFAATLADPNRRLYFASDPEGRPLGQIRFDVEGTEAVVSVSVARDQRGRQWGAPLIDAGVRRIFRDTAVDVVRARIKPGNAASLAAFDLARFSSEDSGTDGNEPWRQYARCRCPGS